MSFPGKAHIRDSPPGPGDEMDGVELLTMAGHPGPSTPAQTTSGGSNLAQTNKPTPKSSNKSSSYYSSSSSSDEMDEEEEEEPEPDDPPVRDGGNATTIGYEFELLVAASRFEESIPDSHREDGRWLSENLIGEDKESSPFKYTCRNKIIDVLVAQGVSAHKTEEPLWFGNINEDFEWWDSLEYENPNQNDHILMNWMGNWQWNPLETDDNNVNQGAHGLITQFLKYHVDNNIEPYMTRQAIIQSIRDTVTFMIDGDVPRRGRLRVMAVWYEQVTEFIRNQKRMHYSAEADPDPNLVPGLEIDPRYTRWSCTDDVSIENSWPTDDNYIVPFGSVPIDPYSLRPMGSPPDLYTWFGAEVVSSVLDYDNPQTYRTLKTVCAAIRDAMRIHKPMAFIESGLHVHVGQQGGWTLLHLKKFATLWQLVESSIFKLHRKDRRNSYWCEPMAQNSHLARLVYRRDDRYRAYAAMVTGPKLAVYETQLGQYIPDVGGRRRLREFLHHLWLYDRIEVLNSAMVSVGSGCIRWGISGNKLSDPPGTYSKLETLEFRLMQGTLDADHIWKWTSILERLVVFARDSTADVYRNAIAELLEQELPDALGLNKDDLAWFRSRATDEDHFAYPENGEINWSDPFMVPGYGDTHNPPN